MLQKTVKSYQNKSIETAAVIEELIDLAREMREAARRGEDLVNAGDPEGALASFSYGHGWLDAAVTAGFFYIVAERDLFTV
jgi:hypothetical protein